MTRASRVVNGRVDILTGRARRVAKKRTLAQKPLPSYKAAYVPAWRGIVVSASASAPDLAAQLGEWTAAEEAEAWEAHALESQDVDRRVQEDGATPAVTTVVRAGTSA